MFKKIRQIIIKITIFAWVLSGVFVVLCPNFAFADTDILKQKTKAVFLYKLFDYVSRSSSKNNGGNPFQLCIYDQDILKKDLEYIQNKKSDKQFFIRSTSQLNGLKDCDILYLGTIEGSVLKYLKSDKRNSLLTISDAPNSFDKGVMISIFFKSSKLRLNINRTRIYQLGFELKPKIFRLTDQIK